MKGWAFLAGLLVLASSALAQSPPVISITPLDSVVERGASGTTQRVKITRTGDTTQASTVTYTGTGTGSNPALTTDFFPTGLPSGSVTFAGDPPVVVGQCATLQPPAVAIAAGVTQLAFCDDFSTDTLASGSTAATREITGGMKWTTERATGWGGTPDPESSFTFNADGTLTVIPIYGNYNWFMSSTASRNGVLQGYYMAKKTKRYVEIRWKFQKGTATARQPGFWSMDTCHLYGLPGQCPTTVREYVEDDWWEYTDQNSMGLHWYNEKPGGLADSSTNPQGQQSCGGKNAAAAAPGDNIWFTAGNLFNVNRQDFVRNGQVYYTRTATGTCYRINPNWTVQPAGWIFNKMANSDLPILIGSKPGEIITIDYVAVWVAP